MTNHTARPPTPMLYYSEFDSPLGTITLQGTERGLSGLYMENHRHGPTEDQRAAWIRGDDLFADARAQLEEYFAGTRNRFDLPLDREAIGGTAFQRRVWAALEEIPYGETISYGELARRIDNPLAVRAVGLASGRNPVSIIVPCHRVIGASGKLVGYGGGMERKTALLALERRQKVEGEAEAPAARCAVRRAHVAVRDAHCARHASRERRDEF